jgi:hypothetical protein
LKRIAALGLVALVLLSACDNDSDPEPQPQPNPQSESPGPAERARTNPTKPRIDNVAQGLSRRELARALRDLRRLGVWKRLTKHLYAIQIDSRLGLDTAPDDGHLADAYSTVLVEEGSRGLYCDLMFWPSAIRADLARWKGYWANGQIDREPPTLRQYWAALLGHELAHCLPGRHGEDLASDWEERIVERLRRARSES